MLIKLFVLLLLYKQALSLNCQNGGVLNQDSCVCPTYWAGDECEKIQCINGGYGIILHGNSQPACRCPLGYQGVHCESVTQINPNNQAFQAEPSNNFYFIYYNLFSDFYGKQAYGMWRDALNRHLQTFADYYKNSKYYGYIVSNTDSTLSCACNSDVCSYGSPLTSTDSDSTFMILESDDFQPSNLDSKMLQPFSNTKYYWCYKVPLYNYLLQMIRDNSLENTAITILSQHPPLDDSETYTKLINTALAFRIRINILWSDDQTFIRCSDDDVQPLRDLARKTDGIFTDIPHQDTQPSPSDTNVIDIVLTSHVYYEPLNYAINSDTVTLTLDPLNNDYYILSSGNDATVSSDCSTLVNGPRSNSLTVYMLSGFLTNCEIHLANPKLYVKVFSAGKSVYSRVFASFVEHPLIDSSNIMPYEDNNFFISLRFDSQNSLVTSIELLQISYVDNGQSYNLTFESRAGYTFYYITTNSIACKGDSEYSWIQSRLKLTLNNKNTAFLNRALPLQCMKKASLIPTTMAPTEAATITFDSSTTSGDISATTDISSTVVITTDASTTIAVDTTITNTATSEITTTVPIIDDDVTTTVSSDSTTFESTTSSTPEIVQRTFVLGYSNTADRTIYEEFLVSSTNYDLINYYTDFGEILFQTKDTTVNCNWQHNYTDFIQSIYNDIRRDKNNVPPASTNQILNAVTAIANGLDTDLYQNSLVNILTDVLPPAQTVTAQDTKSYKVYTNKGVKLIFWMDLAKLDNQVNLLRSTEMLDALAAISNGHVIISNQTSPDFKNLIQTFLSQGPGQNLFLSNNFFGTFFPDVIGEVDLSNRSSNTTIYISATYNVSSSSDIRSIAFTLRFNDTINDPIVVNLNNLASSNFYSARISLPAGKYIVTSTFANPSAAIHLRFWTPINPTIDIQTTYMDYNNKPLSDGPDNFNGAALRTELRGLQSNQLSMVVRDCSLNKIMTSYLDASQVATLTQEGFYQFVPIFCQAKSNANCLPGIENIYFAQIQTPDGEYMTSRSFYCSDSQQKPVSSCQNIDEQGNIYCSQQFVPFIRGPGGKLIDCSGEGVLQYDTSALDTYSLAPYTCSCRGEATGVSCEKSGSCQKNIKPGLIDTTPRTFTVVIGITSDTDIFADEVLEDAKKVLQVDETVTSIWQYQLLVYCSNMKVISLYIGSNPKEFNEKMVILQNPCKISDTTDKIDLSDIWTTATQALGQDQRGNIVFFLESNYWLDKLTVNKDAFYKASQFYKQQLFIHNAIVNPQKNGPLNVVQDSLTAAMSTGGTVILDDKLGLDATFTLTNQLNQFYQKLAARPSSLNYHNFDLKGSITEIDADIESTSSSSYVIFGNTLNTATTNSISDCYSSSTQICQLSGNQLIDFRNSPAAWGTVIVFDGVIPVTAIVADKIKDDDRTAVSVNAVESRTVTVINLPDGYNVLSNNNPNSRILKRDGCTFEWATYVPFKANDLGLNYERIVVKSSKGETFPKVFPFVTTETVDCKNNGEAQSNGNCKCADNFEGTDCTSVVCGDGIPSGWGKSCNCETSKNGGRFCTTDFAYKSFFFNY